MPELPQDPRGNFLIQFYNTVLVTATYTELAY